jgi:hypothetical protein
MALVRYLVKGGKGKGTALANTTGRVQAGVDTAMKVDHGHKLVLEINQLSKQMSARSLESTKRVFPTRATVAGILPDAVQATASSPTHSTLFTPVPSSCYLKAFSRTTSSVWRPFLAARIAWCFSIASISPCSACISA